MRRQGGISTVDLILSSHHCGNADVFPLVMSLHIPLGALVADVTYGKGVFWRNVNLEDYRLLPSDITSGVDCRKLPYENTSIDAVIFDPPYMEGSTRNTAYTSGQTAFKDYYGLANIVNATDRYHGAILALYIEGAHEAYRVLKDNGVLILKCQDEVCAGKQRLTHVEIINALTIIGYYPKDLFVVTRKNRPVVSRIKKQVHARKNHSYFLVFVKRKTI